ncbi:MAG: 5'-nucleotidase [Clostridia bacterium]|nr:5'-nucleotidase [Clostridia bacterium]
MPLNLNKTLVVGISSRALFDLEYENEVFEKQGLEAYRMYQIQHENEVLKPGAGFAVVKALLNLNTPRERRTEVIIMSRNTADTSLRIFNSIDYYGLDISRAALAGGTSLAPYLPAFNTDLFLSADGADVQAAINANVAAGTIITNHSYHDPEADIKQLRIAFDGDAVLFSDESERIYKSEGMEAFLEHEKGNAKQPLKQGPFAKLLMTISNIQEQYRDEEAPIRTALVTARNAPAHERVVRTLRAWGVRIDEAFFLGGVDKSEVLKAFGAHIFFDDQLLHTSPASAYVASATVPYRSDDRR